MRGSPIRKSSDQRSVDSSPRLIAASYVLHRLLVPRHPPCALNNLATQKHRTPTPGRKRACGPTRTLQIRVLKDARVHCAVLNVRPDTGHPTPPDLRPPRGPQRYEMQTGPARQRPPETFVPGPALSGPNSVPTDRFPASGLRSTHTRGCAVLGARDASRPNWSAFHPRAPPHTLRSPSRVRNRPGVGAALDRHTGVAASAP